MHRPRVGTQAAAVHADVIHRFDQFLRLVLCTDAVVCVSQEFLMSGKSSTELTEKDKENMIFATGARGIENKEALIKTVRSPAHPPRIQCGAPRNNEMAYAWRCSKVHAVGENEEVLNQSNLDRHLLASHATSLASS